MGGLLGGYVGVSVFQAGAEEGVLFSQGFGLGRSGGPLLVPPVERLITELIGLVFPLECLSVKLITGCEIVVQALVASASAA